MEAAFSFLYLREMKISNLITVLEMRKARFGDIEVKVEKHDPYGHREYHSFTEPKNHVEIHEDGKETILVISD